MGKQSYPLIDIFKFTFAIGIVALHAHPLKDFYPFADYMLTQCFTRIGVPFFFVAAGFFLFGKMKIDSINDKLIKEYIVRIFKMLLLWTVIYIPIILWNAVHNQKGVIYGLLAKVWSFVFMGSAEYHLWFLHGLIIAVFLMIFFIKRGWGFRQILVLAGTWHIIALLGGSYYFLYLYICPEGSFVYETLHGMERFIKTTNGFTVGFLYVAIGALIGFTRPVYSKTFILKGLMISWLLFVIEAASIKVLFPFIKGSTPYVFLIPATIFTFLYSYTYVIEDKPVYRLMRKMSMYIYFIHPWFIFIVGNISKRLHQLDSLTSFVIVILLTLISARMIIYFLVLSKKDIATKVA